jgi:hypothetical protein
MSWKDDTKWESDWWGGCFNTLGEELKQLVYMEKMGYKGFDNRKSSYNFQLNVNSVIDVGGGPVSILLKCTDYKQGTVIDPCVYPAWVSQRYKEAGIRYIKQKGEDININEVYDLALMYNVLEHTEDPQKIIKNALTISKELRVFEWTGSSPRIGHPTVLTANMLNEWLGGRGKVETLHGENGCYGESYYGIFKGEHYGE